MSPFRSSFHGRLRSLAWGQLCPIELERQRRARREDPGESSNYLIELGSLSDNPARERYDGNERVEDTMISVITMSV